MLKMITTTATLMGYGLLELKSS